jgi:hypothetical protein
VTAARSAAKSRAQHPADHDRRSGLWCQQHFRRHHPDPGTGPGRLRRIALHRVQLGGALLALARGADYRSQSPRGGLRHHRRTVDGLSGYNSIIGPDNATIGRILREHLRHLLFGKNHNTPDFQISLTGPYGFMGGESDQ